MQYEVTGGTMPVAIMTLHSGETLCADVGDMGWMTTNIEMSVAKNAMKSGEWARYTCKKGTGLIAFPASFPGAIMPFQLGANEAIVCQSGSMLCAQSTVENSIHFSKRVSGITGDGFVLQKLVGPGIVLLEIGGTTVEYTLGANESLKADASHIAVLDYTIKVEMQALRGLKGSLFSSEVFMVELTGPGRVWMQTMPMLRMAGKMMPFISR